MAVLERGYEVLAADFGGVHADFGGVAVHHALDEIGGLRSARASVGVNGRGVGEDAGYLALDVVYAVRTHEHEAEQVGWDGWRERGEIRSHVCVDVGGEPGDVALGVSAYLHLAYVVASVCGGEEVLLPALDPLDGPAEVLGYHARDHFFGVEVELAAESAANVGGYDSYLVLGVSGDQGEKQPDEVGNLGGCVNG